MNKIINNNIKEEAYMGKKFLGKGRIWLLSLSIGLILSLGLFGGCGKGCRCGEEEPVKEPTSSEKPDKVKAPRLVPSPTAGSAVTFRISHFPPKVEKGVPTNIQVEAVDDQGRWAQDYLGKITFESSDPQAKLPRDFDYRPPSRGLRFFAQGVTLNTPGKQTVIVKDVSGKLKPAKVEVLVE
ncbi:MAG: hypothetical protein JSU92_03440 [Deltaproteobacteria bacterium]|nr:MAG: hypothetical protein JSU92_03440 [Deltaproteobacteria bacterium]